jgi:hypothetical protein
MKECIFAEIEIQVPLKFGVKLGKYEKNEVCHTQLILERKVEASLGQYKKGVMYEVGSRYISMCEGISEVAESICVSDRLRGSVMSKWSIFMVCKEWKELN